MPDSDIPLPSLSEAAKARPPGSTKPAEEGGPTERLHLEVRRLIEYWMYRAARMQEAHYTAERSFNSKHYRLGIAAVTLGVVVSSSVFATVSIKPDLWAQIIVGLLSITATLLTALQTFLKYNELSDKHRLCAAKFAHINHRLELLRRLPPPTDDEVRSQLLVIEAEWDSIRVNSVSIPIGIWERFRTGLTFSQYMQRVRDAHSEVSLKKNIRSDGLL